MCIRDRYMGIIMNILFSLRKNGGSKLQSSLIPLSLPQKASIILYQEPLLVMRHCRKPFVKNRTRMLTKGEKLLHDNATSRTAKRMHKKIMRMRWKTIAVLICLPVISTVQEAEETFLLKIIWVWRRSEKRDK